MKRAAAGYGSLWKELRCFKSLAGGRTALKPRPHSTKASELRATRLQKKVDNVIKRRNPKTSKRNVLAGSMKSNPAPPRSQPRPGRNDKNPFYFDRDLWTDDQKTGFEVDETAALAIKKPRQAPPTLRFRKASAVPAIQLPHPGSSYNPSAKDHEDLLNIASQKASDRAVEERRLMEFSKRRTAVAQSAEQMWMDEMSQGLPNAGPEAQVGAVPGDDHEIMDEPEIGGPDKSLSNSRKTKKERRKEKSLREQGAKRTEAKKKRIRDNEIFRSRKILKELKEKESADAQKALERKLRREDPARVLRLGKHKFEPLDPEVKLKDELSDSLRTLQAEGSLILDRYKNLQRRNIVEPRIRQKGKRKYKLKSYKIQGRQL